MNIFQYIKSCILLLIIISCSHIKLDLPKNEIIDTVEYEGQEYLIPIPKDYCRYSSVDDQDKPFIEYWISMHNFSTAQEDLNIDLIAMYANCKEKEMLAAGSIRGASRVISIGIMTTDEELPLTRGQVIQLISATPDDFKNKIVQESINYVKDQISNVEIAKSGFSKKRQQIIMEEYQDFLSHPDIKIRGGYNDDSSYYSTLHKDQYSDVYSAAFNTKLYNSLVSVAFENRTKKSFFNRGTEKLLMSDREAYVKQVVKINDENNFREYYNNKLKIFPPKNLAYQKKTSQRIVDLYNEIDRFDVSFKEAFFRLDPLYVTKITVGITSSDVNLPSPILESKESYLEVSYVIINATKILNNSIDNIAKERNAIFYSTYITEDHIGLAARTLINHIPITIMAEVVSIDSKTSVQKNSIDLLKQEVMEYIDLLDQNQ
jgi:hypothetical protein